MLRRKAVIIGGLKIQYYQSDNFDDKNALVFLHGWGSQAMHFKKTLEKCGGALAIDLPGFGKSETPNSAWSLSDYANFFKEFLKKLDIKNPVVAGHSFGGSIGIKYCSEHHDVKKLILIGSAGIRGKNAKKYIYLVMAKIFGALLSLPVIRIFKKSIRRLFYKAIDSEDYVSAGQLSDTYKKIINEDIRGDMKKISVPVVLIWGENDKETPLEDGKLMRDIIADAKLHVISNAGHYAFLDNEKEFEKIFLPQII